VGSAEVINSCRTSWLIKGCRRVNTSTI
jgi:hypothetical protein